MTEPSMFGVRLKRTREHRGLSIQALADKSGVPYATISRIERGLHQLPSLIVALKLARALGVGMDYLAGTFEECPDEALEPAAAVQGWEP